MSTKEVYYSITDGPSKDRLFDAVKYAYDKEGSRIKIGFTTDAPYTTIIRNGNVERATCSFPKTPLIGDVRLVGIIHDDGSGHNLNLIGYCGIEGESNIAIQFNATYNAHRRKGVIKFPLCRL